MGHLSFSFVDVLVVLVILASVIYATYRGFVQETLTIFAWAAAAFATLYFGPALAPFEAPIVAATDYVRNVPDQIRPWVTQPYVTLGTDGFGRSDARAQLRRHFEVDHQFIALAALKALADAGRIERQKVSAALVAFGIDPDKADPLTA